MTNNNTTGVIVQLNSSEHNHHVELLHTSDECFQNAQHIQGYDTDKDRCRIDHSTDLGMS